MQRTALALLMMSVLASCGGPTPNPLLEVWEAELLAADRAFNQATAEGGTEGWISSFADDGAMISAGVGEIRGIDAIRQAMDEAFADPTFELSWEPIRAEVSSAGDLGYTVGRYSSVRGGTPDQQVKSTGLYVSIWRRQEDGSWKVEMDLGNPTSQ